MEFSKALGATFRELDSLERDGNPLRVARASRTYRTSQHDFWTAVTEKQRMVRRSLR